MVLVNQTTTKEMIGHSMETEAPVFMQSKIEPIYTNEKYGFLGEFEPFFQDTDFERRYAEMRLDYYRKALDPADFFLLIDFVGEESIGLKPEHFEEIYYPEP